LSVVERPMPVVVEVGLGGEARNMTMRKRRCVQWRGIGSNFSCDRFHMKNEPPIVRPLLLREAFCPMTSDGLFRFDSQRVQAARCNDEAHAVSRTLTWWAVGSMGVTVEYRENSDQRRSTPRGGRSLNSTAAAQENCREGDSVFGAR